MAQRYLLPPLSLCALCAAALTMSGCPSGPITTNPVPGQRSVTLPNVTPGRDSALVVGSLPVTIDDSRTFILPDVGESDRIVFIIGPDSSVKGLALASEPIIDSAAVARALVLLVPGVLAARDDLRPG